ncbi:membrane fusion protein (multidrug efflux system) [Luteibacter sp. Sphag1AF]|uniref:efflux RND transporter periplasmic adaptor subunit n=1 Tax=Luteibacter sp. Sphag1AF TaxID=2587031 RepID=UPI00161DD49B|nr:efflux RND transporter periplasmic adaptor subunit [Luteibacter sp. Sphag1AF]MBB3227300.1 membrane fusion protein (multidrug efflux system) [Luteibacter sp. Sphag1AF]
MKPLPLRTSLLCLGLAAALAGCGKGADKQQQPPPPEVGVIEATPQNAPLVQDLVGRLSPYRSGDVRARVPGVLMARTYEEGTDVKKGQVLFKIDPAPLRAALDASLANLAQAQATAANNKAAADRASSLVGKGYVSRADYDAAIAAQRTADAAVKQAQADVQTARINLGFTDVTAPIDGRAGQQQVTEGALVGQSDVTLLTTVDQIDPLYVNFTLGVSDVEQMRRAAASGGATLAERNKTKVDVALPDGTPYGQAGTLDFASVTVNPQTGTVNLRAQLPNPDKSLLPGTYVTIKAYMGDLHGVFLVPQKAVQRDANSAYVLTVGPDNNVVRKNVKADNQRGLDFLVTSGLAAHDKIIVGGLPKAKEGKPVNPKPYDPKQDQAGGAPQGAAPAAQGQQASAKGEQAKPDAKSGSQPEKQ